MSLWVLELLSPVHCPVLLQHMITAHRSDGNGRFNEDDDNRWREKVENKTAHLSEVTYW